MHDPLQLTLAIDRPHEQRFDNFVVGENQELYTALQRVDAEFSGFWLFGASGSGRSHLLRASCTHASAMGLTVCYVTCSAFVEGWVEGGVEGGVKNGVESGQVDEQGLSAALAHAAKYGQLVAVDDVQVGIGLGSCEEHLLAVYQRLLTSRGRLLVSHTQPATATAFVINDSGSRLRSLMHFHLNPLRDEHKAELLRNRAASRGYELSSPVLDYWLARGPRDVGALLTDLDVLDRASLVHKQRVTIPLLKQVLGY